MIRIGTRESKLAIWQAEKVRTLLKESGHDSELVFIKSKGDLNTEAPLHELGTVGIFTKALDDALLNDEIDIAVHSCKDLPTVEPEGIHYAAYLERGSWQDVLVCKNAIDTISEEESVIATGSIRRTAQWKNRYVKHKTTNLRGNVNTRLEKVKNEEWLGGIFAKAGLERLGIRGFHYIELDWMIPAPAQGVVCVTCRKKDEDLIGTLAGISHMPTEVTSLVERQFLNILEGGCSAPIGALAVINGSEIHLRAVLLSMNGKRKIEGSRVDSLDNWKSLGKNLALEMLGNGGDKIIDELKRNG